MEENISNLVLYKDNQIISFNKPNGLLTQQGKDEEKSLLQLAEIYCKHPLGLVHRLDRPASGVCLFAKNKKALAYLNQIMQNREVEKIYWAIVPKKEIAQAGTLTHYLKRNGKIRKAEISDEEKSGFKKAILTYKLLQEMDRYSLLEIQLQTGRFHQIRAQLAAFGFPIKGDVKYGARRSNSDRSIHLHARSLKFKHPISKEEIYIEAPCPKDAIWEAVNKK